MKKFYTPKNAQIAFKAMTQANGLTDFHAVYDRAKGDKQQCGRYLRIFEVRETQCPKELERLARHHISQAKREMDHYFDHSAAFKDIAPRELTAWSKHLAIAPELFWDRLDAACLAIEKLELDPDGENKSNFEKILAAFDSAIEAIEEDIKHLKGKPLREARWAAYKSLAIRWREWQWNPVIAEMERKLDEDNVQPHLCSY